MASYADLGAIDTPRSFVGGAFSETDALSMGLNFNEFPKDYRNGLLITKGRWAVKFGGYVKADLIHDRDPIDTTDFFDPASIPVDALDRTNTRFHARQTRLNMDARWITEAGTPLRFMVEGDFYGSGEGSWLDLIIAKDLAKGRLVYPGPLNLPHAWAYLPDLARAFVAAAGRSPGQEAPAFQVLHFAGHTLTGAQFLDLLEAAAADIGAAPAAALNRGWKRAGMPWPAIRLLGIFVPTLKAVAEMSYLWRIPHALDSTRLVACTGPIPDTPPRQALAQALLDLGFGAAWPAR